MLDLNDVALFVQVVRSGSFAEAARRLGMPSNTVSRRVQQLEAQLGTRLLQRSTRKLTLTHVGEGFYGRCVGAVDGLMDAGQALMHGSDEPAGLVRIAAMADFFDFFPMEWIADFLAAHPRVQLDFVLSDARVDLITDRIDVAFRGGVLQDSGYVGRQLLSNASDGMVASPAYIAARGMPKSLDDLARHHSVNFPHPSGLSHWQLIGPDGQAVEVQIPSRFNANTAQALRKAAVAGLGIAVLPSALSAMDLEAGRLVRVLPQYRRNGFGLNVLYPSRRQLPRAVSAFIALVMEKLELKAFPARPS
ncbi:MULTISPECIES: LysR family transcriptional regulator [Pseudomonas]|jgi:DNA-binding transcriptional LysR family regulator|uniref:LysR family transcriptional regulator n=1 Tax=Pseudomonas frederiksbergensis TaxID=104087 RepID=A0A0B1Z109_9PSED|nr:MULTISPECIES: LysR family transcriptional regulator [Pseudomonas]KHK64734.1 LysR family transcriptional regulator [Pseudomonas frederiksbergensis]KJH86415.1 LysR family transcriptional regulator [Pseudomonas fluorescens]MBI6619658.1 LysR family transcriptional regulator [Pseudomonas corrugata]MBI6690692.1 LysR family transcriptional regulator [Pseudomonas corrugata]WRV70658.1 LysR family transcriptional regulator [Pseudomonas frederiksbergensis]